MKIFLIVCFVLIEPGNMSVNRNPREGNQTVPIPIVKRVNDKYNYFLEKDSVVKISNDDLLTDLLSTASNVDTDDIRNSVNEFVIDLGYERKTPKAQFLKKIFLETHRRF